MGTTQRILSITGQRILVAGLAIQVATCIMYFVAKFNFLVRMAKKWYDIGSLSSLVNLLILGRSFIRVVEYFEGKTGYIHKHEWMLYLFDASLMLLVLVFLTLPEPILYMSTKKRERVELHHIERQSV